MTVQRGLTLMEINKAYLCHPGNYAVMTNRSIDYIVVHYVGATGSALQNVRYFNRNSNLGASALFAGDMNGAIHQSVDPKHRALVVGYYKHPGKCRTLTVSALKCSDKASREIGILINKQSETMFQPNG